MEPAFLNGTVRGFHRVSYQSRSDRASARRFLGRMSLAGIPSEVVAREFLKVLKKVYPSTKVRLS